ncbi:MAG: glycosyltransferase [Gemmatimonadetes bacterium]|nr:glycosyltransferase [Gemmatimonadota bacterium]
MTGSDSVACVLSGTDLFPGGTAVLEALASGLPVVAGDVGGVSEIVCSPELGTLVPPGDVQACIVGLRRLLLDPDMAQVMGDRARHSLHGRFDGER